MSRYVVTRFLLMIPTLLAVAVLIFLLVRVVPGDIVELRLVSGGTYVTKDVIQAERPRRGMNKPIGNQFADWMVGLVRLDFGVSMWSGDKITHEIAIRLQLSLELAIPATITAPLLAGNSEYPLLPAVLRLVPPADVHAAVAESRGQSGAVDLAGAGRGLPLLRGGHADDPLRHAGGAAGGLHPHRLVEGTESARDPLAARPAQRPAAGDHGDRAGSLLS